MRSEPHRLGLLDAFLAVLLGCQGTGASDGGGAGAPTDGGAPPDTTARWVNGLRPHRGGAGGGGAGASGGGGAGGQGSGGAATEGGGGEGGATAAGGGGGVAAAGGGGGGALPTSPLDLSGTVTDANGAPVANAVVSLSANPLVNDVSGADGSFELVADAPRGKAVPPRFPTSRPIEHTIVVAKSGYLSTYRGVPAAQASGLSVTLRPAIPATSGGQTPSPTITQYPGERRAVVTMTFDDTLPSQLTTARPLFDQYGYKATFYVNSGIIGPGQLTTWDKWQAVAAAGHEIGNHSRLHMVDPDCTPEAYAFNQGSIAGGYDDILANLGAPPLTFAFPAGGQSACSEPIVISSGHVDWRRADHVVYTDRVYPEGDLLTVSEAIADIDSVIAHTLAWNGAELSWFLFYMHDVTDDRAAVLEAMLDYIRAHDDQVWCTGYGAATLYEREREQSVLEVLQQGPRSATLRLTNGLAATTFSVPLTVALPIGSVTGPVQAAAARAASGGPVEVHVRSDRLLLDLVPSPDPIHVTW